MVGHWSPQLFLFLLALSTLQELGCEVLCKHARAIYHSVTVTFDLSCQDGLAILNRKCVGAPMPKVQLPLSCEDYAFQKCDCVKQLVTNPHLPHTVYSHTQGNAATHRVNQPHSDMR
jgi:hypothetical protein